MNLLTRFPANTEGTIFVALSGMLFGLMGLLGTKLVEANFSVVNMLFWRFLIATIWMIFITLLFNWKAFFKIGKINFGKSFILSSLSYSGGSIFYFFASQSIGTGLAMVVFFCFPVFVTLFACLFDKMQLTKMVVVSLISVMIGLLFLKGEGETSLNVLGISYAIAAAISYAIYVYSSRHISKTISTSVLTILVCLGNAILFFLLSCYDHTFIFPQGEKVWINIWAIGIIATALPIQFLLHGLKYISPVKASIISVLEPIVTVIVGILFLQETITAVQLLGIFIILLGALFIQFERTPIQLMEVNQ